MKLKVICKKCDRIFNWNAENEIEACPYCSSELTIKDVRMNPIELKKYQKYKTEHRSENEYITPATRKQPAQTARQTDTVPTEDLDEDIKGRFQIKKGRTKYGTLEITNPDYMILKLSFWAMGPQQKYLVKELNNKIKKFLNDTGFTIEKRW
ncbi:MAG: hypothetical protein KAJ20_03050 [Candidatus Aenigmarchaeota archaeon]|nr:hypothetical protein [Candidatus Aenigmarchaeota archaeon]MCK5063218.1 hypothetical protein [Candidatus Aenigmarchaeota archaeon]MCK5234909.1 hypothetical protein [Candidatus Aenigmarchaeota archaeon]MCK5289333.1 hypothetical protein [Candidatus Aenigmarchaeota archaeon]MCK5373290.1 hypothetical protein [Candidatus Aenigmarchaeota archaeon]